MDEETAAAWREVADKFFPPYDHAAHEALIQVQDRSWFNIEGVIRDVVPAEWLWPPGYRPTRWERFVSRLRGLLRALIGG